MGRPTVQARPAWPRAHLPVATHRGFVSSNTTIVNHGFAHASPVWSGSDSTSTSHGSGWTSLSIPTSIQHRAAATIPVRFPFPFRTRHHFRRKHRDSTS